MVTAADIREHNRSPDYIEDTEVNRCLRAAISHADAAGVPRFENNGLYDLLVCDLAGWYFDNRGLAAPERENAAERMFRARVLALRGTREEGGTQK